MAERTRRTTQPRRTFGWGAPLVASLGLLPSVVSAAPSEPLSLTNPLVRTDECEYCHSHNNAPDMAADPLYSAFFSWRGSMMANSARDPVFWAGVAIASQDAPDPAETEACIRCHAPRAFLEGRGGAIAQDELRLEDLAGVECELCHRMVDDGAIGNGQYAVDDTLVGENVPRRGPWSYDEGPIPAPLHETVADTFVGSSAACGTCHDVTTGRERRDADGMGMGTGFNEQRTYSEWAGSDYAEAGDGFRSCQDCHMPAVADVAGCRDYVTVYAHAEGGRRHDLLGANRFVIELLAEDATLAEGIAFSQTLELMDAFVRTAATLEVAPPESVDLGAGLDLDVVVTNETGHKLPTGYSEGRVMWLEVVATVGDERVWSSGVWDEASQAISQDEHLHVYRAVAQEYSSGQTFHLLLNDQWIEDTRIPPLGLLPSVETDPVGGRYELQDDGTWPHFDAHTFQFPSSAEFAGVESGELQVAVRLLYLVNTPEYVDFLAAENVTNDAGSEIATRFDEAGGAVPLVLAEQTVTIPIVEGGGSSSSGGTGNGSDPTTDGPTGTNTTDDSGSTSAAAGTGAGTSSESSTAAPQDGTDDGCSCRAGAPRHWGWSFLLLTVPIVGRRRRRRRNS